MKFIFQTSMSAQITVTTVMIMQFVATHLVVLLAAAMPDTLVMEYLVQVISHKKIN